VPIGRKLAARLRSLWENGTYKKTFDEVGIVFTIDPDSGFDLTDVRQGNFKEGKYYDSTNTELWAAVTKLLEILQQESLHTEFLEKTSLSIVL